MKLDDSPRCSDDEYAAAVVAIVGNVVFPTESVKRENIRDAVAIEVYLRISKLSDFVSYHSTFVAMYLDRGCGRLDIRDVGWVREQVHRGLTVQEKVVSVDGHLCASLVTLSENDQRMHHRYLPWHEFVQAVGLEVLRPGKPLMCDRAGRRVGI